MKSKIPVITGACIAAFALCTPSIVSAQSPSPSASTASSSSGKSGKMRPMMFHGEVASVDSSAKSFTIGSQTFMVTGRTKIKKGSASGTMDDITSGEKVRGSYWKKDDGTLEAKSVRIAKSASDSSAKKEGTESSPAASPTASP